MGKSFRDGGSFRRREDTSPGFDPELKTPVDRPPLQWSEAHTVTVGAASAVISEARGARGDKLYSFVLGRQGREPGRTSKFFQPRDLDDLGNLVDAVRTWLDKVRAEPQRDSEE